MSVSSHPVASLYVHVPFCAQKCDYCAFYSHAANGAVVNRFVTALMAELLPIAPDLQPKTIFFGGGTPSLLNLRQWEQIMATFTELRLNAPDEWTIECNPATVSLDKARLWRAAGVNRISMGVQSFDETLLDRLGRIHSRAAVFKSYDILREAGFNNINLDLMFAIPGQSIEVWEATLAEAMALAPEHLSSYEVIYEEDTPLFARLQAGEFSVDEALACRMYDALIESAEQGGYHQYEVANFARHTGSTPFEVPSHACAHNVNYWRGGSYHGLGPSAAGYVDGVRTKNISNTQIYCERVEQGLEVIDTRDVLPALARAGETAAFGLRMNAGWDSGEFERVTGFDLNREWSAEIERCVTAGWLESTSERLRLTPAGMRFADAVAGEFLKV